MRKLIVTIFMSLDGVVEAPGGEPGYAHTGWVRPLFESEMEDYKLDEQVSADTLVLGRVTYESFAGAWPEREGVMADKINAMEKVVVSTTIDDPGWNNVVVARSVAEIAALRAGEGGDILVVGSRTLVQALFAAGLVDQLNLQLMPLVLGSGFKLFAETPDKLDLTLLSISTTPTGVSMLEYTVG